jgi:HPt (histidine-containing phosphotransfer) domain-containing protein
MTHESPLPPNSGLDPNAIERLRDLGGEALVSKVLRTFVVETPQRRETAHAAHGARDAAALAAAMHGHASAAGWLGAEEMLGLVRQGERLARDQDWGTLDGLMGSIDAAITIALADAERRLSALDPA